MSSDTDLRATILGALKRVAPEVDVAALDYAAPLRDPVDLDSMDWLNFLVGLHGTLGIDIPEADYANLRTVDDLCAYARAKLV
jgi:acyl carrier protein